MSVVPNNSFNSLPGGDTAVKKAQGWIMISVKLICVVAHSLFCF